MNCHKTASAIARALRGHAALTGPATTSTTSAAPVPGVKTLSVGSTSGWQIGMCVRAQSAAASDTWLAGIVTAIGTGTLTCSFTVANGGPAARADWSVSCGFHVYAHDIEIMPDGSIEKVREIQTPAVHVSVSGQSLCGSAKIGKMKAILLLGSQSDMETAAIHSQREKALRDRMADVGALTAAFAAEGGVLLKGRAVLVQNDPGVEARAFTTPLTFIVGVEET